MIAVGYTDTGLVRGNNQDNLFFSTEATFPLYMVADGMGGHRAGEIASYLAIEDIKNFLYQNKEELISIENIESKIVKAIILANKNIYTKSQEVEEYKGMGTTLTLAYIHEKNICIGHIGDSRAYYIDESGIQQITEDHSLVNELLKNGDITQEEAKIHPQRNIITRALGSSEKIKVDIFNHQYKKGSILLICSDGLTNMVREKDIYNTVFKKNLNEAGKNLINTAKEKGGLDNISIVLVKL